MRGEILRRILGGTWHAGEKLPSCRAIAAELGSNANTVNRELQRLSSEGIVRSTPRQGTYVTGSEALSLLTTGLDQDIDDLVTQAVSLGVSQGQLMELVAGSFARSLAPAIAFTECNPIDLEHMSYLITNATGITVDAVDLEELAERDRSEHFDLILVPLFHFREALEIIGDDDRVLELNFAASATTLREIATLDADRVVSVAAPTVSGTERTAALVRTLFPGKVEELTVSPGGNDHLEDLDVLIYVNALQLSEAELAMPAKTIRVEWGLDGSAADQLRARALLLTTQLGSTTTRQPVRADS